MVKSIMTFYKITKLYWRNIKIIMN